MAYRLNGYPVHNPAAGLTLLDASEWTAGTTISRPSLNSPGIPGSVPMDGVEEAPAIALLVGGHREGLTALRALLAMSPLTLTRDGLPGSADVELATIAMEKIGIGTDPYTEATVVLNVPGVYLRGEEETFTVELASAKKTTLTAFPGISGRISDAIIRFTDVTNPRAESPNDPRRFIAYQGIIRPGEYVRVHLDSGRAWKTVTETAWSGGTQVDPLAVISGAAPGFLQIAPVIDGDPFNRVGSVNITCTAIGASAAVTLRGKNAHVI